MSSSEDELGLGSDLDEPEALGNEFDDDLDHDDLLGEEADTADLDPDNYFAPVSGGARLVPAATDSLSPMQRQARDALSAPKAAMPEPSVVTYEGTARITPASLRKHDYQDRIEFSVPLGNLEDVIFSRRDDNSEAMNALGPNDYVTKIELEFDHNTAGINYCAEFPTIAALASEKLPAQVSPKSERAPHGVVVTAKVPTGNVKTVVYQRTILPDVYAYLEANAGHNEESILKSFSNVAGHPELKYIQMEPVRSQIVPFYEALSDVQANLRGKSLLGKKADEAGNVLAETALIEQAMQQWKQAQHDYVGMSHVTDTKTFKIIMRALPIKKYSDKTQRYEAVPFNLATMHETALAATATKLQKTPKEQAALAAANQTLIVMPIRATVYYYKFARTVDVVSSKA